MHALSSGGAQKYRHVDQRSANGCDCARTPHNTARWREHGVRCPVPALPDPSARRFPLITCSVCGGTAFSDRIILWDELASEWQLAPHERAYVDRQQGTCCNCCGSNLRSLALSDAIRAAVGTNLTLLDFAKTPEVRQLAILEINEAGNLSTTLRQFPGHVLASYPAVDMHSMPYLTNSFDIIVHSDTLEHVSNPIRALAECRRVLRPHGALCFTIPTIIGRLTRCRGGLPKSYHGSAQTATEDFVVHTEFGADMWTYVMQAGFSSVALYAVDFPSALAMCAKKQAI
jgi:SAM-dependent methyltransferase